MSNRENKMAAPRVYADFHNADPQGRVRLNCVGTQEDLSRLGIQLRDGLLLDLYADDADVLGNLDELQVRGVVQFSPDEGLWVAVIDWSAIRHVSELVARNGNGTPTVDPLLAERAV
jgi:hypothetical protein